MSALTFAADARAEAGPTKPRSGRKIFDFSPPHPGEIVANPAKGSGAPPRLKEFAPSAALRLAQDEAGERVAAAKSATDTGGPGSTAGATRPAAAGPPVRPGAMQTQLSDQIVKLGIEGYLSQTPQGASPQEQQYRERVHQEIAASLATWQALYAAAAKPTSGAAAAPASPPVGTGSKP